jgi:hypothetical protein
MLTWLFFGMCAGYENFVKKEIDEKSRFFP